MNKTLTITFGLICTLFLCIGLQIGNNLSIESLTFTLNNQIVVITMGLITIIGLMNIVLKKQFNNIKEKLLFGIVIGAFAIPNIIEFINYSSFTLSYFALPICSLILIIAILNIELSPKFLQYFKILALTALGIKLCISFQSQNFIEPEIINQANIDLIKTQTGFEILLLTTLNLALLASYANVIKTSFKNLVHCILIIAFTILAVLQIHNYHSFLSFALFICILCFCKMHSNNLRIVKQNLTSEENTLNLNKYFIVINKIISISFIITIFLGFFVLLRGPFYLDTYKNFLNFISENNLWFGVGLNTSAQIFITNTDKFAHAFTAFQVAILEYGLFAFIAVMTMLILVIKVMFNQPKIDKTLTLGLLFPYVWGFFLLPNIFTNYTNIFAFALSLGFLYQHFKNYDTKKVKSTFLAKNIICAYLLGLVVIVFGVFSLKSLENEFYRLNQNTTEVSKEKLQKMQDLEAKTYLPNTTIFNKLTNVALEKIQITPKSIWFNPIIEFKNWELAKSKYTIAHSIDSNIMPMLMESYEYSQEQLNISSDISVLENINKMCEKLNNFAKTSEGNLMLKKIYAEQIPDYTQCLDATNTKIKQMSSN